MDTNIVIRPMTATDACYFEQNGLLKTLNHLSPSPAVDPNQAYAAFNRMVTHEGSYVFVADSYGELVGFIKLITDTKFSRGICKAARIEDVTVRPGYEGKSCTANSDSLAEAMER